MTKDEEIKELKIELQKTRQQLEQDINTGLIKALEIQPGKKYALFFGRGNGLRFEDIARISDPALDGIMFVLNDVDKVDLVDREQIKKHFNL